MKPKTLLIHFWLARSLFYFVRQCRNISKVHHHYVSKAFVQAHVSLDLLGLSLPFYSEGTYIKGRLSTLLHAKQIFHKIQKVVRYWGIVWGDSVLLYGCRFTDLLPELGGNEDGHCLKSQPQWDFFLVISRVVLTYHLMRSRPILVLA